jgi:hypothetical protein
MKIRTGFVSNSSSSSFVLRGIPVKKEQLAFALKISQEEIDKCGENYQVLALIESKLNPYPKYGALGHTQIQKKKAAAAGTPIEEEPTYELDVHNTGNYFGSNDYDNLIIGKDIGGFQDGEVEEIGCSEETDKIILTELAKLGLTGPLRTYVQMVSNDNY